MLALTATTAGARNTSVVRVQVLGLLVGRQNTFLQLCREQASDVVASHVALSSVTESALMTDISDAFVDIIAMYTLQPKEIGQRTDGCPFLLDRIMHTVRRFVVLPLACALISLSALAGAVVGVQARPGGGGHVLEGVSVQGAAGGRPLHTRRRCRRRLYGPRPHGQRGPASFVLEGFRAGTCPLAHAG